MKVRDEHAILRGLPDFRVSPGAPDPAQATAARESNEQEAHRKWMREQRAREGEEMRAIHEAAVARYEAEQRRIEQERIEAIKRGEVYVPPEPPYDPYRDMAHVGFMTASVYAGASAVYRAPVERNYFGGGTSCI